MKGVGLGTDGDGTWAEFGTYFAEHEREVGLLAFQLCGERDVAEELTADAFAEAWRCWDEWARVGVARSEAMRGIVQRLAQGRVRAAGRGPESQDAQDAEELDGARVRALLAERITLIPPEDAPTVVIARIVEPAEPAEESATVTTRFRRPVVISAVIVAGSLVVIGAVALAASGNGGTPQASPTPLSLAATGTFGSVATVPRTAGGATSGSPSRSASPSPSRSPSTSPSASARASASSSPTGAASSTVAAVTSATSAATTSGALTASASVNHGSNGSWTQLDVATTVDQPLSALTITITVADCPGLSAAGAWNSGAGGQFGETTTTNADGSITYVFALTPGNEVTPGQISFAAQFSHAVHSWSAAADTYSVTAEEAASRTTESLNGAF
jgi:DNA-directed RNA polymerase specialized sigma24 family protein